ncbi:MAG: HAMP domain-containing histidine kinase [Leptospiraceae bacterium]|nr:HAMP domain-containing histidine kinase [Leptospiraceae bacterium]
METAFAKTDMFHTEQLVDTIQKLSLANDIESIIKVVRSAARELTNADGATFVLRDENMCYYVDEDAIGPLWKGHRFPIEACISGWVMLNKKPAVIMDIFKDGRVPIDAYRPTFVKSLVMVPIRTIEPIGAIGNYWADYQMPSAEKVTLLQALADITTVSIENISIRNKLEEKLTERNQMLDQLKKQKQQLEEFTHIISHNLRAPLSNLLILNDMIHKSDFVDDKLRYLEKQGKVVNLLHETFEELVDASQVRMDFSIEKEYLDLNQSMDKAIHLLEGEIIESKANIFYDFTLTKSVHFPKKYMDSIIFNLLSNAIKYRSPDRVPNIDLRSYQQNGFVYIEVNDNGLGIDLNKHGDKIFKLRKTFHANPQAKGFGLFITKTQLEAMGGDITVRSIYGQGSTFIVKVLGNH